MLRKTACFQGFIKIQTGSTVFGFTLVKLKAVKQKKPANSQAVKFLNILLFSSLAIAGSSCVFVCFDTLTIPLYPAKVNIFLQIYEKEISGRGGKNFPLTRGDSSHSGTLTISAYSISSCKRYGWSPGSLSLANARQLPTVGSETLAEGLCIIKKAGSAEPAFRLVRVTGLEPAWLPTGS